MRFSLSMVWVLALAGMASAAGLDPEAKRPYKLQVVLHFARSSQLTPTFQDQTKRQIRDNLQAALGDMATVEVVQNPSDPMFQDVLARGLDRALVDGGKLGNDPKKTHFVFISFDKGHYEIQARQLDGYTGLASPIVRQIRIPWEKQAQVARTASRMVASDFGLVGTLSDPKGENVTVVIKAGLLAPSLERWIQKGDIFRVAEIISLGGSARRADARPFELLKVSEVGKDGTCVCQILSSYAKPLERSNGNQGFRCLRLHPAQDHVRLRLVDSKEGKPIPRSSVIVGKQGFGDTNEQLSTDDQGFVESEQPYQNVAYVKIPIPHSVQARNYLIPVDIVGDRTVVCRIAQGADDPAQADLARRFNRWRSRLGDYRAALSTSIDRINASSQKPPDQILKEAEQVRKEAGDELQEIERELLAIKDAQKAGTTAPLPIKDGDQQLAHMRERFKSFEKRVHDIEEIIKKENDPQTLRLKQLVVEARNLEDVAEYDKALKIYETVLAGRPDDKALATYVAHRKAEWEPKSDAHRKARQVIYEEWPKCANARDMKAKIASVKQALATCREAKDYLSPRKLRITIQEHVEALGKETNGLKVDSEDDQATAQIIKPLLDELPDLANQVDEYLKTAKTSDK